MPSLRSFGDPILRSKSSPVSEFDSDLAQTGEIMLTVMRHHYGAGLAANQIGWMRRVFVMQADAEAEARVVVNPVLQWKSDEEEVQVESCLSIPKVAVEVPRSAEVRLRAQDVTGAEILWEASGREARVIQHEIDHLDGILILQRCSKEQRSLAMRALRTGESYTPLEDESESQSGDNSPHNTG